MADDLGLARMADGREVAFRVMSDRDGPVILYMPGGSVPIELLDEDPMYDRFLRILASSGRLLLYNGPGSGSSDPIDPDRDYIEQMTEAYLAVLDAVDADAAWIVASHLPFAAEAIRKHSDRVHGAVLVNGASRRQFKRSTDRAIDRERLTPVEIASDIFPSRADDPAFVDWLRRAKRLGTSGIGAAAGARANVDAVTRFVAEAQPVVDATPVMLIRRREAMTLAEFEWWNGIFPDAECITIEGADVGIEALDAGLIAELAAGFITGTPIEAPAERMLVGVLFTDLVDSTPAAAASGDAVWRSTLDRYEASLQRTIRRHHGTLVKHTGDGALATFPTGSEALHAASELRNTTRDLGLEGRSGIHVGEVEQRGEDIGGIAVHLAARVMGQAEPGEIIVTSALEQATIGARFQFDDLGTRMLKGLDRPWQLFAARQHH